MDRRSFLRTSGALAAASALMPGLQACGEVSDSSIPQKFDTDILVVGGGPAGVCAAIAAARLGSRVMVVESGNCLGGMATKGMVAPFMTSFDSAGEQQVIKGLFDEIVCRMVDIDGAIHPSKVRATSPYSAWITAGHDHCTPFEPEAMKYVLDQMTAEAGVKVLFHAQFVRPVMKGDQIKGAVILAKSGLQGVSAKCVIDCTGDGDVAAAAGVPFEFGNQAVGKVQPSTLFFHVNGVDSAAFEKEVESHLHEFRKVDGVSYRTLHWRVAEAEAAGEWDIARKSINIYKCVKNDHWAVNCTRVKDVDATDSESLTSGEIEGRRQVQELMNFFHKYVPAFKNASLMSSASTLGIRESRHILGQHILQAEDLIAGVVPDDSILLASNSVDVHGGGKTANSTTYTTINAPWYGVPYRCLVPQGVKGLLVAGRCLSATSDAAGAVRVMPPAMAMGEAAGTAAALALKAGINPDSIDIDALRKQLKSQNVFL